MVKLYAPRLALAMAILGVFMLPPTESYAAKTWLEKLFQTQHHKPAKKRKPRAAARAPGDKIVLPDTAPLPEPSPRVAVGAGAIAATAPAVTEAKPSPPGPEEKPPQGQAEVETPAPSGAAVEPQAESPASPPTPTPRPDDPQPGSPQPDTSQPAAPAPEAAQPVEPPKPEFRPDKPQPEAVEQKPAEPPPPPDPRSALRADPSGKLPDDEIACRRRLSELGVKFTPRPAETDPLGCSIPYPIVVKSLGPEFELAPDAEMNCAMAEAAARFAKDVVSPAAQDIFGETLKSISHASAYVCRPRNGTNKLSEHAFGNALDIASFKLSGGTTVAVEPAPPEKNLKFLTRVRGSACGPFKTVLGPGSNSDHAEHLHFDLAPRKHGGTVCE